MHRYHIFGSPLNRASDLEASCPQGSVHVESEVAELIRDEESLELRESNSGGFEVFWASAAPSASGGG